MDLLSGGKTTGHSQKEQHQLKLYMLQKLMAHPKVETQIDKVYSEYRQLDEHNLLVGGSLVTRNGSVVNDGDLTGRGSVTVSDSDLMTGLVAIRPDQAASQYQLSSWGTQVALEARAWVEGKLTENPLNGHQWSTGYPVSRQRAAQWPAADLDFQLYFLRLLEHHQVLLVQGSVSSGQSGWLPLQLLRYFGWGRVDRGAGTTSGGSGGSGSRGKGNQTGPVVCVRPTRLGVKELSGRVARWLDVPHQTDQSINERKSWQAKVGFKDSQEQFYDPHQTKLVFVTDEVFLNELLKNPNSLSQYSAVMLDQIQTRTAALDLILYFLKKTLESSQGSDFKIVLTSIESDLDLYQQYLQNSQVAVAKIPDRSCRIAVDNSTIIDPDYPLIRPRSVIWSQLYATITGLVEDILLKKRTGRPLVRDVCTHQEKGELVSVPVTDPRQDIVIFLPSKNSLTSCQEYLTKFLNQQVISHVKINLLSDKSGSDGGLASKTRLTQIWLAQEVEQLIEITGIVYVIDSGLKVETGFQLTDQTNSLMLTYVSITEANQRIAQAGMLKDGLCYRLYSNHQLKEQPNRIKPEIQRMDLRKLAVQLLSVPSVGGEVRQLKQLLGTEIIQPITRKHLDQTLADLQRKGLLEVAANKLGGSGYCLSTVDLSVPEASLLLLNRGLVAGALISENKMTVLVTMMSMNDKENLVVEDWFPSITQRQQYANVHGDLFGLYQLYEDWQNQRLEEGELQPHVLDRLTQVAEESRLIRNQLKRWSNIQCQIKPTFEPTAHWQTNFKRMLQQIYYDQLIDWQVRENKGKMSTRIRTKSGHYVLKNNLVKIMRPTLLQNLGQEVAGQKESLLVLQKRRLGQFPDDQRGVVELLVGWLIRM